MHTVRRHLALILTLSLCALAPLAQQPEDLSKLPIATLQQRAAAGDPAAQNMLGYKIQLGLGFNPDNAQAIVWYRKAAEQGYPMAQSNLGTMYRDGLGVPQDYAQALAWYRKAAGQNLAVGQWLLGAMYEYGNGVAKDYVLATAWYLKAATQEYPAAQNSLGYMYQYGEGVTQDNQQALDWYRKAAAHDLPVGQYNLGFMYEKGLVVAQDYVQATDWYLKAANQNYAPAQSAVGYLYQKGLGVPQDETQAVAWYRKAADQGFAEGQDNLARMYESGSGVSQDLAQARLWFQKAAAQGYQSAKDELAKLDAASPAGATPSFVQPSHEDLTKLALPFLQNRANDGDAASQAELGHRYAIGRDVPQDYAQAAVWLRKAADHGSQPARDELAKLNTSSPPAAGAQPAQPPEDINKVPLDTLRQRAEAGDAVAQNQLAYRYYYGRGVPQDDAQTVVWGRKAADQGLALAQSNLGNMYKSGRGVPQDYTQALVWYRKAAAQNFAASQYNLGAAYENGQGVTRDDAQALAWYRKAADQNYSPAQNALGLLYEKGRGVPQDDRQALTLFRKAADQNFPPAQTNMGLLYEQGRGVPQDYEQSMVLYRKAADQGDADAEYHIGSFYVSGLGVPRDVEEARRWFERAAAQKHQPAKDELAKLDAPPPATTRGFVPESAPHTAPAATAIPIPHNYALIFATGDYAHWPHLTNPIPDADAINQALTSLYAFRVEEIRNATDDQILAKLTDYLHRRFEPQDQLFIFFSGHGYFDPDLGKGFLVPANALRVQDDVGHRSLLAHETIMGYVNRIPARHVVLVLDACFAGTLDRRIADNGLRGDTSTDIYAHASLPELLARKEPKRTRRYITSGGKDYVPDGLPGHHSPFISAFLVTLNQAADRKGYLTLDDIQQGLNTVNPEPRWGDIQDDNDPGADFLLLTPNAIAQLTKPD